MCSATISDSPTTCRPTRCGRRRLSDMLERGEAIGLLVILAVMLVATLYVAGQR